MEKKRKASCESEGAISSRGREGESRRRKGRFWGTRVRCVSMVMLVVSRQSRRRKRDPCDVAEKGELAQSPGAGKMLAPA